MKHSFHHDDNPDFVLSLEVLLSMDLIEGSSDEDDSDDTTMSRCHRVQIISAVSFERVIPHTRGNDLDTMTTAHRCVITVIFIRRTLYQIHRKEYL